MASGHEFYHSSIARACVRRIYFFLMLVDPEKPLDRKTGCRLHPVAETCLDFLHAEMRFSQCVTDEVEGHLGDCSVRKFCTEVWITDVCAFYLGV